MCGWERDGDREGERDDKWVVGEENESKIVRKEIIGKGQSSVQVKCNITSAINAPNE